MYDILELVARVIIQRLAECMQKYCLNLLRQKSREQMIDKKVYLRFQTNVVYNCVLFFGCTLSICINVGLYTIYHHY